jgi:predicted nucleic acid-binding protein
MILYLDASSLVKRYVAEPGSTEVGDAISSADVVGTARISRPEVAAALANGLAPHPADLPALLEAWEAAR